MSKSTTYASPYGDSITYFQPRRWRDDPSYDLRSRPTVVYDDIVDDADFSHLREQNRVQRLSQEQAGQATGNPLYDYPQGKNMDNPLYDVDDSVIALRSGRLDKADVCALKEVLDKVAADALTEADKKKAEELKEKISQERQEFIDKELGFAPTSQDSPV